MYSTAITAGTEIYIYVYKVGLVYKHTLYTDWLSDKYTKTDI